MPSGDVWLSLKVSEKVIIKDRVLKPGTFISVPKSVVPLATRRNRLRRLIREAVRADDYFGHAKKIYYFRVHRWPGDVRLQDVKRNIEILK
jgi:RNase P protein component